MSEELIKPEDRFEAARGKAIYEVEVILDHCRDNEGNELDGWRMKAIREAAQRIESAFID